MSIYNIKRKILLIADNLFKIRVQISPPLADILSFDGAYELLLFVNAVVENIPIDNLEAEYY
jgi:hypothetical protein